jgi:hypothetical protein
MRQLQTAKSSEITQLVELYSQATTNLNRDLGQYINEFKTVWNEASNDLSRIAPGPNSLMTYLINCSRIIEICGLKFFTCEQKDRDSIISFLIDFISEEPGCAHIPSDYYAVSLVLPVLALCSTGHRNVALKLLKCAAIWLCDRYQQGYGLADISANPHEEMAVLFGYAFDFIKIRQRRGSFTATVISDLASYVGDEKLYSDVVNDIKASTIFPQYWRIPDNPSLFTLEGKDIIQYPNIDYSDVYLSFDQFSFAEHMKHELTSFAFTKYTGMIGLYFMMVLLRDRYFPTMWPSLVK